jgi:hypothetical protein
MRTPKLAATLLVVLPLVLSVAPARAETVNCAAITRLPAVIDEPGIYCFTGHLETSTTSGIVIEIRTDNVVLDLNGFRLSGLPAGLGTQAKGISALARQNITARNGTISGFLTGISLAGWGDVSPGGIVVDVSRGYLVEHIRAVQNTHVGIDVGGLGAMVRNNQVVATGGSTFFGSDLNALGIRVTGRGSRVLDNDVTRTVKRGSGGSVGIFPNAGDALVANNRITEADIGIGFFVSSAVQSTGKYRDSLTFDVTMPYVNGTDAGNNN